MNNQLVVNIDRAVHNHNLITEIRDEFPEFVLFNHDNKRFVFEENSNDSDHKFIIEPQDHYEIKIHSNNDPLSVIKAFTLVKAFVDKSDGRIINGKSSTAL